MIQYDPRSAKAEEFIHDGEILDTLEYAARNKSNYALIASILKKASLMIRLSFTRHSMRMQRLQEQQDSDLTRQRSKLSTQLA